MGLRNDNGLNGEQDGYEFSFGANVDVFNIDIRDAFNTGLDTWCPETNIRFKIAEEDAPVGTQVAAGDGYNIITVGSLSSPDAQAALIQSQAYFPIDCGGSSDIEEQGGFIMTDLDFVVNDDFALGNDQDRAERVFEHEIGHGHNINHARCTADSCSGPLMHPMGETGIQIDDINGGDEIFNDSQDIINDNDCELGGDMVDVDPIQTGGCGISLSEKEVDIPDLEVAPNPTSNSIRVSHREKTINYQLLSSTGVTLLYGKSNLPEFSLNLDNYAAGTYILILSSETGTAHYKIVKL